MKPQIKAMLLPLPEDTGAAYVRADDGQCPPRREAISAATVMDAWDQSAPAATQGGLVVVRPAQRIYLPLMKQQ